MEARKVASLTRRPFQFSLRIRHPSMDPADISRELDLEASHSFRAGAPRESSSGVEAASVHGDSYWLAPLDISFESVGTARFAVPSPEERASELSPFALAPNGLPDSLEGALALCGSSVLRPHAAFMRRVRAEGGEVGLLIELSVKTLRGFTLAPQVSRALSELGVVVDFEFAGR